MHILRFNLSRRWLAITVLMVASAAIAVSGQQPSQRMFAVAQGQGTFLVLSDLHFDPFADPGLVPKLAAAQVDEWGAILRSSPQQSFSQYGSDANYALLASSLQAAQAYAARQRYDFVVVTGDYLAHNFRQKYEKALGKNDQAFQAFVIKTMIFVSRLVQQNFPTLPVFGALGNNDSVCGDYRLSPGGAFLASVGKEWKIVASNPEALRDFMVGGFYATPHPAVPNHELLVLNSTLWSSLYQDACSSSPGDPGSAELDWLAWKLYQLRLEKKTASLIMHIPPGIDAYTSSRLGNCGPVVPLWNPKYASRFAQIIQSYKDVLRDGYAGHMHMDDFRVMTDDAGTPFFELHAVPAVSPVYRNNPAFEIGLYDQKNGGLVNYVIIYLTNLSDFQGTASRAPVWSVEYSVDSGYHIPEYSPEGAEKIVQAIRSDEKTRAQYIKFYAVQSAKPPSVNQNNWLSYSCAQDKISADAFHACACATSNSLK